MILIDHCERPIGRLASRKCDLVLLEDVEAEPFISLWLASNNCYIVLLDDVEAEPFMSL